MAQLHQGESRYMFAQAMGGGAERERIALIQNTSDAHTIRYLNAVGVGEGWACLDVGAGGGSIARWFSERVGPSGHVVATDRETDALGHLDAPNVEVICHDILADALPHQAFDLVHARFVLLHLPERDKALTRMVSAVRPGGWVVVGDFDLRAVAPARPSDIFTRVWAAFLATVSNAGADIGYGERIPGALEEQGLVDVQASGERAYCPGGSTGSQLCATSIESLRGPMLATDLVSDHDIDALLHLLTDPAFAWRTGTVWTGWGRKPESAQ